MREIRTFELEHGEPAAAWRAAQPLVVKVMAGRIWLTVAGDAEDYWLEAGESFRVPRGAVAWISAERGAARVALAFGNAVAEPSAQSARLLQPRLASSRAWRDWFPRWLRPA